MANTGRTTRNWVKFILGDTGNTLREIAVDSINGIGLVYDEMESTAFMDLVKGTLNAHPDLSLEISGPVDTTASTGSHVVLTALMAAPNIPHSLDIKIGIRHAWDTEPQFGITYSANASGVIVTDYKINPTDMKYTATIRMFPGSSAPAWGTTAET